MTTTQPTTPQRREVRQAVQQVADALHVAGLHPSPDLAQALLYMGTALAQDHAAKQGGAT